jgi:hypothetical protein
MGLTREASLEVEGRRETSPWSAAMRRRGCRPGQPSDDFDKINLNRELKHEITCS